MKAQLKIVYDPTDPERRRIPEGKTCADCYHINTCISSFGGNKLNTECVFSPSFFYIKKKPVGVNRES